MDGIGAIDWKQLVIPDTSLLEIFIRGTIMYLLIFAMMRFVFKREAQGIAVTDLLVVVLIADAAQNAMAGQYNSVPSGLFLVATIIFWSLFLNWLAYRVPAIGKIIYPPPLPLVKSGRMLRRNMRRELITEQELMTQLRENGVERLDQVKLAQMESDGRITVIPFKESK